MTDLRNLPEPVRERLADFLVDRHRGFDIDARGQGKGKPAGTIEERITPRRIEIRTAADGSPIISGYATVYEHAYDVAGGPPFGWTETMARGAADKSVAEADSVYLLYDHEGLPLAATKAGTLALESDKLGLFNEARPDPGSPYSNEVVRRIQRGELDAMSVAFKVPENRQEWNKDYTERRILEIKLYDVSVVANPANPATVVQVRGGMPVKRAAVTEPTVDPDEDLASLAASIDAVLDEIQEALVAGDMANVTALLTAAEVTSDALLALLGVPDADDVRGAVSGLNLATAQAMADALRLRSA